MQMETKYLRLSADVALGSRFDDWQVCWLGGGAKHRLYYLVMLVKVPKQDGQRGSAVGHEGMAALGRDNYLEEVR